MMESIIFEVGDETVLTEKEIASLKALHEKAGKRREKVNRPLKPCFILDDERDPLFQAKVELQKFHNAMDGRCGPIITNLTLVEVADGGVRPIYAGVCMMILHADA